MIVQNQTQLPPEITPEACRQYTKTLENPNNIKPSLTFGNIGRFCYARGLEFWHLGNTKKIAEALKKHYDGQNLSAADIAFFSKRVVKELEFVDQATLDQAQFHTPHTHVQQQLSKLALLKGNGTPPSSPNAQASGSKTAGQDSAGQGSASGVQTQGQASGSQALASAVLANVAQQVQAQSAQIQSSNGSGSGSASGSASSSALGSDSAGAVDSVGSDDTASAVRDRRVRSRRASTSDALDVGVSGRRGRGRRSSETDVQALAQANLAAQANAQAQSVAEGSGSSRPLARRIHKIDRTSIQYEVQQKLAKKLFTPAERKVHQQEKNSLQKQLAKKGTEQEKIEFIKSCLKEKSSYHRYVQDCKDFIQKLLDAGKNAEVLVAFGEGQLQLDKNKADDEIQRGLIQIRMDQGVPAFEDVKVVAKFLEAALKDGKKAEALKVLGDLPLMAQLALLEIISDEYVDLLIEDMKESYIHMNNFDDKQKEKGNNLTVMQVRYTFFTYLETHKDDADVGARIRKLIDALDPKA